MAAVQEGLVGNEVESSEYPFHPVGWYLMFSFIVKLYFHSFVRRQLAFENGDKKVVE